MMADFTKQAFEQANDLAAEFLILPSSVLKSDNFPMGQGVTFFL
jgi:hypothetical protein